MLNLTFGEQVKIILSRKGMTIKELAEKVEEKTGKKMSRQNLTQRLGRDNFQEQDMRTIAEILECPFQLNILVGSEAVEVAATEEEIKKATKKEQKARKNYLFGIQRTFDKRRRETFSGRKRHYNRRIG